MTSAQVSVSAAIDILMPFRNATDALPECLESIASQTFPDWRLVAVDDGSTDQSASKVAAFARQHGRTTLLSNHGEGLVSALNTGLRCCAAPVVARMDADDIMLPYRLERQWAWLYNHPETGVVGCQIEDHGLPEGFRHYAAWSNGLLTHHEISDARFIESPLVHPSVSFRRDVVERHGGYRNGNFPEDYEIWLRWLEAGVKFAKLGEPLLHWRDHEDRLTRTDTRYHVDNFFAMKAGYLARWLDDHNPFGKRVWIWGAGYETRRRIRGLREFGVEIEAFIDIDQRKIGTRNQDGIVVGPGSIPSPDRCFVLTAVGNRGARDLIRCDLDQRGFKEGRNYLCIA